MAGDRMTDSAKSADLRKRAKPVWATPSTDGIVDQSTLDEIVRRVVEAVEPERIVLFGSAARGEMDRHSDIDLLVVKAGAHKRDMTGVIYRNLRGVGAAVDVVVVTPDDIDRYKDSHALVIKPALRDGRVVYGAA